MRKIRYSPEINPMEYDINGPYGPERVAKKNRKQRRMIANGQAPDSPEKLTNALVLKNIKPKTKNQSIFFDIYEKSFNILAHGVAGTGKSFLAIYCAMREITDPASTRKKLYIVRTAVPSRDIGFLPGNEKEKIAVFEAPYKSIFAELYGRGDAYDIMKRRGLVEFTTTSFARGITYRNAIVIFDEAQNGQFGELDTIITRLDNDCRLLICGDYRQTDLQHDRDKSGIHKFMKIVERIPSFRRIEFDVNDIVRGGLVKEYITAKMTYEDETNPGSS